MCDNAQDNEICHDLELENMKAVIVCQFVRQFPNPNAGRSEGGGTSNPLITQRLITNSPAPIMDEPRIDTSILVIACHHFQNINKAPHVVF